jgi:hypothetical protein
MDGLRRVTLRFGTDFDVRYVPEIPEPGDAVTHEGALWIVTSVATDAGGVTVTCAPSTPARVSAGEPA